MHLLSRRAAESPHEHLPLFRRRPWGCGKRYRCSFLSLKIAQPQRSFRGVQNFLDRPLFCTLSSTLTFCTLPCHGPIILKIITRTHEIFFIGIMSGSQLRVFRAPPIEFALQLQLLAALSGNTVTENNSLRDFREVCPITVAGVNGL